MTVLDTNVVSETLKPSPSGTVLGWLAVQDPATVFTTTITMAELLYGIEALPAGKRRARLFHAIESLFANQFRARVLPFDEDAARMFPKIVAHRDRLGRTISQFDALIASICRSRGAGVATRNVRDFEHCGISIVNPWG